MCLLTGEIVIGINIINTLKDYQLAGLLAHEIMHHKLNHCCKARTHYKLTWPKITQLSPTERLKNLSVIKYPLSTLPEQEADIHSALLYGPIACKGLLEFIQNGNLISYRLMVFLKKEDTHPKRQKRVDYLSLILKAMTYPKPKINPLIYDNYTRSELLQRFRKTR